LAKKYASKLKREFAILRVISQTCNKRFQTDIFCPAEILKSRFITFEPFWAFESINNFLDLFLNSLLHDLLYQSGNDKDVGGGLFFV
jgi:hypothetical protein